jgi:DNA-directed RNA polymerase specialized sigma24 family protein
MVTLEALSPLTPRQCEAIELRYSGVPEKETARRLEISGRRVRYLVSAARRRLARRGHDVRPLPVGRPKSAVATGDAMNFDDL